MRSTTTFLKLVLLLSLIGIGVSVQLLSIHNRFTTGQALLTENCSIGGEGCNDVAASKYSEVLGVPLASIAMGYYFTILLLSIWALRNQQGANEPLYASFFLATLAILVTVTMFVISDFVLGKFCQYCAMLWLVNLAIWPCLVKQLGLSWGNALGANSELLGGGKVNLRRERLFGSFGTGVACLVVFGLVGVFWKGAEAGTAPGGGGRTVEQYNAAPIVMLSSDAYGGLTSKGFQNGIPVMDIVEMADFQCPACRMAAQSFKPFLAAHPDKVRLTFRNYPLDDSCNPNMHHPLHLFACKFARGGICAAKQNKFWEYNDQIYGHQSEEMGPSLIDETVKTIGLDAAAFDSCLKDPATGNAIQKDIDYGTLVNLESTPTVIINGHMMVGAHPPSDLEALLDYIETQPKK